MRAEGTLDSYMEIQPVFEAQLKDVAEMVGGAMEAGNPSAKVCGVSTDSRAIVPGSLFVALEGERFDGHDFVAEALGKGCAAAVVSKGIAPASLPPGKGLIRVADTGRGLLDLAARHRSRLRIPFVAVTGSAGKSSTKEMLARMLGGGDGVLAPQGSFNNAVGLPLTILRAGSRHRYAVVELGTNGPGEIGTLAGVARPDVGVITMAGPVHLERLGSVEGVAKEKGDMLDSLAPGGIAVLNRDDPFFEYWRSRAPKRVVSFGFSRGADIWPEEIMASGESVTIRMPGGIDVRIESPVRRQAINALAALAAGAALGLPMAECAGRLDGYVPMDGRFRVIREHGITVIDDAYNASPVSFGAALEALRCMRGSRKVVVAGDMLELGDAAEELHRRLGAEIADAGVDALHAAGPLAAIAAMEARKAGMDPRGVKIYPDAASAAAVVPTELEPGDVILVKGSHSTGMRRVADAVLAYFRGTAGQTAQTACACIRG